MVLQNFIVLEGIDGAGTTTQLNILRRRKGTERFLFTTEPTDCPTGRFLRTMLAGEIRVSAETAAYLFAADRSEHLNGALRTDGDRNLSSGIAEACAGGHVVVSDRYLFSSLAYQSIGCGMQLPAHLNALFPLPRLLFYLDIDPELSLGRISGRGKTEIYEKLDFLSETRKAYEAVLSRYEGESGMEIVRLDATRRPMELSDEIWRTMQRAGCIQEA